MDQGLGQIGQKTRECAVLRVVRGAARRAARGAGRRFCGPAPTGQLGMDYELGSGVVSFRRRGKKGRHWALKARRVRGGVRVAPSGGTQAAVAGPAANL
jgi:hypothetical protein